LKSQKFNEEEEQVDDEPALDEEDDTPVEHITENPEEEVRHEPALDDEEDGSPVEHEGIEGIVTENPDAL